MAIVEARQAVERAIERRIFPAAAVEVGDSLGTRWAEAQGTLTFEPDARPATLETIFDLASLTKVIATTPLMLQLVSQGRIQLDALAADCFPEWRGEDRRAVTVRDLLEHASGLPARLLDAPPAGRREFEHEICSMPLEYPPRTRSVYSDLGFILLGFLAADRGETSLAQQFNALTARLKPGTTDVNETAGNERPGSAWIQPGVLTFDVGSEKVLAAPTLPLDEDPRRGRMLTGEVHDAYAAALGGAAGHAGVFGTASAVGAFARVVLRAARGDAAAPPPFSPATVALSTTKSSVPSSSRALGWDTMLPTSSCGTHMSGAAFGHVGFTGTSLWIDPPRDRYYVLLTNRACGGGSLEDMRTVRRAFHDALAGD